ncbi:MAG: DUF1236 domain-containing protein [Rhizobiaceae bacterium]|nr:DUF1236 domain-containing protein [Rhizobiaceae bacterium]MCV0405777.1 DUF1236 domain-containing protein [Rhizobiaceae bacterium]
MRRILFATAAISALSIGFVQAQEAPVPPSNAPAADEATDQGTGTTAGTSETDVDAGAAVGIATGATAGAVIGGPVGAVIGGFAGAMIGTNAAVSDDTVDYVVANPVEPVTVQGEIREGYVIPETATLTPVPDDPELAYVYVDGRPVIVRRASREVVYSPGYVVPQQTVTYVRENPVDVVAVDGGWTVGATVPADVDLVEIPSDPAYSYVYTDTGPVVVNNSTRTVVWAQ